MRKSGHVVLRQYALGSKSERPAVMLVTDKATFVLRRHGGNPFTDPELEVLVGKQITCEGDLHQDTFIMTKWTIVDS